MSLSNAGLSFLFAYLSCSCHNMDLVFYQKGLSPVYQERKKFNKSTFNKAHLLIEMHSRWLPHVSQKRCNVVNLKTLNENDSNPRVKIQPVSALISWKRATLDRCTWIIPTVNGKARYAMKPHTITETLILPAAIDMVKTMWGEAEAQKLTSIPLLETLWN